MDWKLFFGTFTANFIAELGDKTQFLAIAASSQSKSWIEVLLAVVLALMLAGTIGVVAGKLLADVLTPKVMKYLSGCIFIALGLFVLLKKG